nr:MAG TPA: hypothetical protein [Caudoviricetes sp.]
MNVFPAYISWKIRCGLPIVTSLSLLLYLG